MSKPDTQAEPEVVITVDGKLAYTVDQAAAQHGLTRRGMNSIIERECVEVAAPLDGNKKVYLADDIARAVAARPGKGWRAGTGHAAG